MTRHQGTTERPANQSRAGPRRPPSVVCTTLLAASARLGAAGRAVVVVDENSRGEDLGAFTALKAGHFVTNRWDLACELRKLSQRVLFSDFVLESVADGLLGAVYFRVAKEKAAVHHVINTAGRLLRVGGTLHLSGMRRDGIKSYVAKAQEYLRGELHVKTTVSGARCAVITKASDRLGGALPDQDYGQLRAITMPDGFRFFSKPGVFGWQKEDPGSALLAATANIPTGSRVLDLGCGYGYLALKAAAAGAVEVWATDNNAAAVAACERNFAEFGIAGRVVPADCGAGIGTVFDVVLCNPPFHQGFAVDRGIGRRFTDAMRHLVRPDGTGFVVVSSFIPLERDIVGLFSTVETMVDDGRFKVICLGGPVGQGAGGVE